MTLAAEIRRAEASDVVALALLMRVTFREAFGEVWGGGKVLHDYLDATFAVDKITSSLAKDNNRYWIAFANGMPVGYAKLKRCSPYPKLDDPRPAQLQKIYMLREYIGRGLGERLQDALFAQVRADATRTLWLAVWKENRDGIRFYQRHGFDSEHDYSYEFQGRRFEYDVMVKRFA